MSAGIFVRKLEVLFRKTEWDMEFVAISQEG